MVSNQHVTLKQQRGSIHAGSSACSLSLSLLSECWQVDVSHTIADGGCKSAETVTEIQLQHSAVMHLYRLRVAPELELTD